ncbi:hypothetical protein LINPERPRIM_LOCUS15474 [Linum perenne]
MSCASEAEVDKILKSKRWEFPGHKIRADKWLENAGTSNLVGKRVWTWFLVKKIPLHLRSEALLREVARRFGEKAIFYVAGCNLNEVRVRVTDNSEAPDGIWIQFREKRFWIPVVKV